MSQMGVNGTASRRQARMKGLFRGSSLGVEDAKGLLTTQDFRNFRALLLVQALSLPGCFIESLPPFLVADQGSDYNKVKSS
jgi:hypothetical protein